MSNAKILAALRKKLGDVSLQAISQRRAKIQALVPMPVDIATYVIASREACRFTASSTPPPWSRLPTLMPGFARASRRTQVSDPPRRARAKRNGSDPTTTVKQLQIGNFTPPVGALNPQHTTDAVRMAEVYPMLYTFENSMREYIDGHLTATSATSGTRTRRS